MPDVFLSYSRDDQATARRFAEALQREGFEVWWDAAINPGETFDQVTENALKDAKAVVVLWSKNSVASRWVRSEASQADRYGTLVPVTVEPCNRPIMFELSQTTDLSKWNGKPDDALWRDFVESLHRFVGRNATAAGNAPQSSSLRSPVSAVRTRRAGLIWAAVAAGIVAGAILLWNLKGRVTDASVAAPAVPAAQATTGRTSVAVMPFENRTGDVTKEYFGDGLAEELINALTRLSGLQVPARSSTFSYKGKNADVRTIAKDLNVDAVLEGSVQSAGDTIRLTTQLVDGSTGFQLWSRTYERDFKDLFKLQDELTNAIVREVGEHFHADVPATVSIAAPTSNLDAYSLYLRARALANSGDLVRGRELLREALRLDPQFALALATLAQFTLGGLIGGTAGPEVLVEGEALARQALAIDSRQALAYETLGSIAALRGKWVEAAEEFQRARALQGGTDLNQYAMLLAGSAGKVAEVERAMEEAYRRAPDVTAVVMQRAAMSLMIGRNDDARRLAQRTIDLGGAADRPPLTRIFSDLSLRAGDPAGAGRIALDALSPRMRALGAEPVVRGVYAGIVDPARARDASRQLAAFARSVDPDVLSQEDQELRIVSWFTLLGDLDAAFEHANRTADVLQKRGIVGRLWVWVWLPELTPFRRDARFQALTERIGLMDYWRKYGPPDSCELTNDKLICR